MTFGWRRVGNTGPRRCLSRYRERRRAAPEAQNTHSLWLPFPMIAAQLRGISTSAIGSCDPIGWLGSPE